MNSTEISRIIEQWKDAPKETHPGYFRVWQRAAVELEKALRCWVPELYFQDLNRFEDRAAAYPMIIYAASRPCYGRPKTEFTYDVADSATLKLALRSIGNPTRNVLAPIEARLRSAGRPDLAIRYAPVWYQDIFRAVEKKPKMLIELLADEARLVNAVIDLGTTGKIARFQRAATLALWSVAGQDMRELAIRALELTTGSLIRSSAQAVPAA